MIEIEGNNIQFFVLIPMLLSDDLYRVLDPDELVDVEFADHLRETAQIGARKIPEMFQPLFITDDFKSTFRPAALNLRDVVEQQGVQAILPEINFVVRFKWRFETMSNFGLLVLELQTPTYTSMEQLNDLIDIVQRDTFSWSRSDGWLLPHESITQLLNVPPNEVIGLSTLVDAFSELLGVQPIIKAQHPFVAYLLQMDISGGDDFYATTADFGEYLLLHRHNHLSALFGFHEDQEAFEGANWRCSQNLDMCGWFEWQPPLHRDTPLRQHRHAPENLYTSSKQRRRAARRVFKICTIDYIAARTMSHLLASQGEARNLRQAIQAICQDKSRSSAQYHHVLHRLTQLETRAILLNANIENPDWVLENPFGEGNRFVQLMSYMSRAYGVHTHIHALQQQIALFDKMLDRCL